MMESGREVDNNARDTIRVMAGLFLSLFTIFCMVSLVSFLFTWISDQSLEMNPDFLNDSVMASNWGGKLGYKLAAFLFASLFGFGAFAVPVFSGISAVACFRVRKVNLCKVLLICLFGCAVVSLACSYICSFSPSYVALFGNGTGGSYGFYANKWLISMLGSLGTGCLVFFVCAVWGMFLSKRVTSWIGLVFDKLFSPRPKKTESVESETGQMSVEEGGEEGNEEQECLEVQESQESQESEMGLGDGIELESVDVPVAESGSPDENADSIGLDEVVLPSFEDVAQENYSPLDEIDGAADKAADKTANETANETVGESVIPEENPTSSFEVVENENPDELPLSKWREKYDPRLSLSHFKLPSTDFLDEYADSRYVPTRAELEQNNLKIVQALRSYKISVTKVSAKVGPTVTLFEVVPAPGVKVSQIKSREEDIARELAAVGVRVVFIPGSNAIGIEVANSKASIVSMRSVLEDVKFRESKMELPVAIGKTISNETMIFDLAKMPHLLVAGATGQGKSVGLNAIITSLLYKKHPSELKLVLVDPKKVELSLYSPIENHYLAKLPDSEDAIITDTDRVVYTLKSLCKLMDRRYDLLKAARVRNIREYNEKFLSRQLNPQKGHDFMPYIVVIIDEFADLLMTAGRDVEEPITRLAQLARAIGIHLVIATQRPTTNIITGTIKANFPARIAFKVMTGIDSKTILDQTGANRLIGRGDMLISTGSTDPIRVQCALVDTPEVTKVTEFINGQTGFGTAYLLPEYHPDTDDGSSSSATVQKGKGVDRDDLFDEAARLVVREQSGSTSLLQRKMEIGFARAGRLMDQLHDAGIVGPSEGSKARQVRVTTPDALERILDELHQNSF